MSAARTAARLTFTAINSKTPKKIVCSKLLFFFLFFFGDGFRGFLNNGSDNVDDIVATL